MTDLQLSCNYLQKLNYAMQQNGVKIVRELTLKNDSDQELSHLLVHLDSAVHFFAPTDLRVDALPAHQELRLDTLTIKPDENYILQLTERINTTFTISVSNEEGETICESSFDISILPFSEWPGIGIEPALLSSFVTPNLPCLVPVIKRASEILKKWTGDGSLDGYQRKDPNRTRAMAGAVYEALKEQHITYAVAPASFENSGQKVRLADEVINTKLGTCLDTTLLYASCLENIGLRPLLIIVEGHSFAGVWLEADTLPYNVSDDISLLTKHLGLNDIALVETTMLTDSNSEMFENACLAANKKLENSEQFCCVIDVARCRYSHILPLPIRINENGLWKADTSNIQKEQHKEPIKIDRWEIINEEPAELTKQDVWQHKLLDLTLRNSLINYRITNKSLIILNSAIDQLEDALYDGDEFQIMPKEDSWGIKSTAVAIDYAVNKESTMGQFLLSEMKKGKLYAAIDEKENQQAQKDLYRAAKLSIEENGANTLYLALGIMRWYETKVEKPHYAPILLVPVEMVKRRSSYIIRTRDEETMLNITLMELLRQNFHISIGGLEKLPTDEKGIDVGKVLATIRSAIMDQRGWDVLDMALVGNFSFSKFIMWNDIHSNLDALKENKIVNSLLNGQLTWNATDDSATAEALDHAIAPNELALPVSADSSQLEAVYSAAQGESFILHGPPGTGKSQTITNIIANALYQGKRVLFAAEKMVALEVVQNRLAQIGLAPFCLEIHSNKARKSEVLEQIKATTEVVKMKLPEEFETEAKKLFDLRQTLNNYVEKMHEPSACGVSIHQAITRYSLTEEEIATIDDCFKLPAVLLDSLTKEQLDQWNDLTDQIQSIGVTCGHPATHPLRWLDFQTFTPELKEQLDGLLVKAVQICNEMADSVEKVAKIAQLDTPQTAEQTSLLCKFAKKLAQAKDMEGNLLRTPNLQKRSTQIADALKHGLAMQQSSDALQSRYTETVLALPAEVMLNQWKQADGKWFLSKWLSQRSLKKEIGKHLKSGSIDLPNDFETIIRYQTEKKQVEESQNILNLFGDTPARTTKQWQDRQEMLDNAVALHNTLTALVEDVEQLGATKAHLANQMAEGFDTFMSINGKTLNELATLASALEENSQALQVKSGLPTDAKQAEGTHFLHDRAALCQSIDSNLDKLKDWYLFLKGRHALEDAQLGSFVQYISTHPDVPASKWTMVFQSGFHESLANHLLAKDESLTTFKGELFEETIKKYRALNAQYQELVKAELYAKLASGLPNLTTEASENSEVGILMRNINNKGRGNSLRTIFDSIPNLLARLCPCMLMSPMSIAQYLDVKRQQKFDLVIFDEASQMPTSEAVGAIARGENVIVVGDPKQMPPTRFFSAANTDEEAGNLDDLDSILDDCLALKMPSKYLQFHYRSKHESLIAFSNSQYYNNKLNTFPSPDNRTCKVQCVKIDGHYDKGKSRQNKEEAKAVVNEVVRRLKDSELRKRSIGIVTFSSAQQTLIDDLLAEVFNKDSELEAAATQSEEPIFIKNLENVQGDERDIILFSVGYGPDAKGKVSMNFGPLNLVGGERRLNVAVSRARYEMMVFTTLTSDMIDLDRTNAEGVHGLRNFLKFAEQGTLQLSDNTAPSENSNIFNNTATHENLGNIIAQRLNKAGYEVDTNVGYSAFRIDVAVIDPKDKGRYLLGILCDGRTYRQASTARDREICQPGILGALGWNIMKVWSVDWWEDKEKVMSRILRALDYVQNGKADQLPLAKMPKGSPVVLEPMGSTSSHAPKAVNKPSTDISEKEYINAILYVTEQQFAIPFDDLHRAVAKQLGFARTGTNIENNVGRLVEILKRKGLLKQEGDKIIYAGTDEADFKIQG